MFTARVKPVLGSRTLARVAADRDAVAGLLTGRMGSLSIDRRRKARQVIVGTLDAAVKGASSRSTGARTSSCTTTYRRATGA